MSLVSRGTPVVQADQRIQSMDHTYFPRIVEQEIRNLMVDAPAIVVQGPRAVGKTSTCVQFVRSPRSVVSLDLPVTRAQIAAEPQAFLEQLEPPVLIDEWQEEPAAWDGARRSVDAHWVPGRFLITGSANPRNVRVHTGAGRFVTVRMRPLSFAERQLAAPTVSVKSILDAYEHGERADIRGASEVDLAQYVREILRSGFPGIWQAATRIRPALLDSYLDNAFEHEIPALGEVFRRPASLRMWLAVYAAAISTTASYASIGAAVDAQSRPARSTVTDYRDALAQLWLLDELPAWNPQGLGLGRLVKTPKHELADPALAARLQHVDLDSLLAQKTAADTEAHYASLRDGPYAGSLFESMAAQSLRVYAQANGLNAAHLRTFGGEHEIDVVLHNNRNDRVLAAEVKLTPAPDNHDVRHLNWLGTVLGDRLVDKIVVTTGPVAYRRQDGVAVVPLALLGP